MKNIKYLVIFSLFITLWSAAMAIEEPTYQVLKEARDYEIRDYGPMIVAQTMVNGDFEESGNRAFGVLADFIFGNNSTSTKVAMTAPVNMHSEKNGYMVQFTMPKEFDLESLPKPNNKKVEILQVPERKVAVYSYSGSWSEYRYNQKLQAFKEALARDGVATIGEPSFARFNSPFQLWFLRRNEIWLEIDPVKSSGF
jgi:effector-binding domain-containing protein